MGILYFIQQFFKRLISFPSYLWRKLKRKSMIISLHPNIDPKELEHYYVEIKFHTPNTPDTKAFNAKRRTNHIGESKCTIPLIVGCMNINEAIRLRDTIISTLLKFDYSLDDFKPLNLVDDVEMKIKMNEWKIRFDSNIKGTLNILTPQKHSYTFITQDLIEKKPQTEQTIEVVYNYIPKD